MVQTLGGPRRQHVGDQERPGRPRTRTRPGHGRNKLDALIRFSSAPWAQSDWQNWDVIFGKLLFHAFFVLLPTMWSTIVCLTFSQTQFLCKTMARTSKRTRQACKMIHWPDNTMQDDAMQCRRTRQACNTSNPIEVDSWHSVGNWMKMLGMNRFQNKQEMSEKDHIWWQYQTKGSDVILTRLPSTQRTVRPSVPVV